MAASFAGRLVLITGASAGIGRATAAAFVQRGARVLGLARSRERLDSLAHELGGPPHLIPIPADVADAASMQAAALKVGTEFGVPDVVVANAGIGLDALFTETSDEALRAVLEVNVLGTVRTVRPFLPQMVSRGSGRILLISSIVGKRGIPHYAAYSASKFALHGMADALRCELWRSGVSVGVVCPPSTRTEFHDRLLRHGPAQRRSRLRRHHADSVARAIVRMAGSRRREVVLSAEGKLLTLANAAAPRLVDWLLARTLLGKR